MDTSIRDLDELKVLYNKKYLGKKFLYRNNEDPVFTLDELNKFNRATITWAKPSGGRASVSYSIESAIKSIKKNKEWNLIY